MVKTFVLCSLCFVAAGAGAFNMPIQDLFTRMVERSGLPANEVTVEQALQRVAVKMNQYLPSQVDKETRLEKMTAETGRQLTYHYTLTALKSNDINKAEFKNVMEPVLKGRLCTNSEMKGFLRNGVRIAYVYRTTDLQPVESFKYSAADCGYKN
jgi:hypothetical protein